MFGDSFFTKASFVGNVERSRFRPHVWGFFFYVERMRKNRIPMEEVFVPMFGDPFFTTLNVPLSWERLVFVPMFGDSFFTITLKEIFSLLCSFRPHVWGFFFYAKSLPLMGANLRVFVPMFGDSFFTTCSVNQCLPGARRFSSPCLGILFLLALVHSSEIISFSGFRPHVWGFFFYSSLTICTHKCALFSSPCLGILFLHIKA